VHPAIADNSLLSRVTHVSLADDDDKRILLEIANRKRNFIVQHYVGFRMSNSVAYEAGPIKHHVICRELGVERINITQTLILQTVALMK
jgi:hypothetical protein